MKDAKSPNCSAAPISKHPKPSVEAFVDACIRVNTSGIRSTPIAASNANARPDNPHDGCKEVHHSGCPCSTYVAYAMVPTKPIKAITIAASSVAGTWVDAASTTMRPTTSTPIKSIATIRSGNVGPFTRRTTAMSSATPASRVRTV